MNIHAVQQQSQGAGVVNPHAQFGIGEVFTRAAVIAVAVGGEAGRGDGVVHVARLSAVAHRAAGFQAVAPGAETAVIAAGFQGWWRFAGCGFHVNHAAGGVAVQCGKRPAQHFHACHAV